MLIVVAKSAIALALGGAILGQQGNQTNRNAPPPAPSAQPTPADNQGPTNQSAAPRNTQQQNIIRNDQQTYQSPQTAPQDQQGRAALGVTLTDDLRIQQVTPGSPAERMGLRSGDEILSLNGRSFNSVDDFINAVGSTPQGQQVRVEIDRNGQNLTQSGPLAPWDQIFYSGSQGPQTYSAMKYPSDGTFNQGQPFDGQVAGNACCDSCSGSGGGYVGGYGYDGYGYGNGGYGYGGWGGRGWRRGGGYYW